MPGFNTPDPVMLPNLVKALPFSAFFWCFQQLITCRLARIVTVYPHDALRIYGGS